MKDSEESEPSQDRVGVSVYHLETVFLDKVKRAGLTPSSSIYDIENLKGPPGLIRREGLEVVCPYDGRPGAAYVHCLDGQDHAGIANFMLSYTWRCVPKE